LTNTTDKGIQEKRAIHTSDRKIDGG